jgi:hypothetical protein
MTEDLKGIIIVLLSASKSPYRSCAEFISAPYYFNLEVD